MNRRLINSINRNRAMVDIIIRIFDNDCCDDNSILNGRNIWDNARRDDFAFDVRNNNDLWVGSSTDDGTFRVWLGMNQMDNDSDTWRGINRVFRISRGDISRLRRAGVVTDSFFDDGTIHIDIDRIACANIIGSAWSDDDIDNVVNDHRTTIANAVDVINALGHSVDVDDDDDC